jgi:hypothetical protein
VRCLALVLCGCVSAPVATRLHVYELAANARVTTAGVSLAVTMVTGADLTLQLHWRELDPYVSRTGNMNMGASVEKSARVRLVPLPSAKVAITNDTAHTLAFAHADTALRDDSGARYAAFTSLADVQKRARADFTQHGSASKAALNELRDAVERLTLLTPAVQIAPGQTWTGVIEFDAGTHDAAELDTLVRRSGALQLVVQNATLDGAALTLAVPIVKVESVRDAWCPPKAATSLRACRVVDY